MVKVILASWALLTGILLLMIGNGLQSTLIGVRGDIEGFSTLELSLVTSAYFLGFLGGSRLTPSAIQRVGHVRVFAALAALISGALILYPAVTYSWAWVILRIVIGFCFSGVYVTAESWLNNSATNETRGQTLSVYMIVQMVGVVIAQALLNIADPKGYLLFVIPSVLVSISVTPMLLAAVPTPAFEATKQMGIPDLYKRSPLAFVGMFILGGVFSAQFGMSAVYATQIGLSLGQISLFVSAIFVGAMVLQYPIGWASDQIDRRVLIMIVAAVGGISSAIGMMFESYFPALLLAAFFLGGMSNPLYSLLLAYANDYLESDEMAGASGSMIFVNGLGAVSGPIVTGWLMSTYGASGFWLTILVLMFATSAYAAYRMTRRESVYAEDDYSATPYAPVTPSTTAVAFEAAQEFSAEVLEQGENQTDTDADGEKNL